MLDRSADDARRATNPLFNDRKLKLGTFGTNVSNAVSFTTIEGGFDATWPNSVALAKLADEMEFEAIVPVARWKGFGGDTNMNGSNFEVYTWAAGLGTLTENTCVLATSHVPTVHPVMAANLLEAGGGAIKDHMPTLDYEDLLFHIMAGWRGFPLVGPRDQVVQGLCDLSDAGLDGCLLVWAEYEAGMKQFKAETLAELKQAGLR